MLRQRHLDWFSIRSCRACLEACTGKCREEYLVRSQILSMPERAELLSGVVQKYKARTQANSWITSSAVSLLIRVLAFAPFLAAVLPAFRVSL